MDTTTKKKKHVSGVTVVSYIVLALLSLSAILPFVLMFTSSISSEESITRNGYSFIPSEFSLAAYEYLWGNRAIIGRAYLTTIVIAVMGTAISLAITLMLAYTLSRENLPGRKILNFLVLFTMLFNGGLVATYLVYTEVFHIKNTYWALLVPGLLMNRLGDYIRQRRQELNLTQEQVCAGICEPVTLSRFENGRQTPSRTRINAILQRLGLPDDRYYALVTPEELEIEALEKEIVACNALKHVNEGFDKISQLEKIVKPDDQIAQQFILRSKVLLGGLDKRYSSDERIQMLMQAVQMTIPNFQLSKIEDYLYTLDEMKLVNQIGNAYSLAGDNEKAADIFYRLLQYMRRHLQEMVTSNRMLPLVLYNFARSLDLLERYEESAKVARNGKEACIKYGHYQVLHSCLEIEAECDFFLGKKEESAERYREAFYICKVMGYEDDLQIIRNEAKKYLDIIF